AAWGPDGDKGRLALWRQLADLGLLGAVLPEEQSGLGLTEIDLVPLMADSGLHHIPVVDEENRFAGIVTQSDLVAALYQSRLAEAPAALAAAPAPTGAAPRRAAA
ncbi:MAG: CBS domain-containing protein, partial [Gammaproteobacteria bacterium]